MSDIPSQIKAMGIQTQEYLNDVDRLVEQFPVFKTPALAEVAKAMKLTLIETSRMTMSIVKLAMHADQSRAAVQEELNRGNFIIHSLQEQIMFLMMASTGVNKALERAGDAVAIRAELDLERDHRQAAESRAEHAEAKLKELTLESESRVAEEARHHSKEIANQPQQVSATALVFPYATKELQAMLDAAVKYWAGYTSDKRQPTQNEVQIEICELLGLSIGKGSTPPRKTIALAGAIKPDSLPEA